MILLLSLLLHVTGVPVVACITAFACIQAVTCILAVAGVLLVHDSFPNAAL
jgi:hypothetical protein